jgi:hypothetical protein
VAKALLAVLAVFVLHSFTLAGELRPGTPIRLTVQRALSTHPRGGLLGVVGVKPITRENSFVIFEVAEDVLDEEGDVVIPEGSVATGRVVDSQVGGGLKPHAPRLAVTVDSVMDRRGRLIPIRFDERHEGKWARRFSRAETGEFVRQMRDERLERAMNMPENSEAVQELMHVVVKGQVDDLIRHPERILKLKYLAQQSGLPTFVRFIQEGKILDVLRTIALIQNGGFVLKGLTDLRRVGDAFRLANEVWGAGAELATWFGRRVTAPQIVVPVGFPVEAVVD